MPATFDDAVEKLIEACLSHHDWPAVERVAVVRDLRGRLRVVLKPIGATPPPVAEALASALGPWFAGPVLTTASDRPDERRLATEILGRANAWPPEWPTAWVDLAGDSHPIDLGQWAGVQRVLGKQSWFGPPRAGSRWPLAVGSPAVVAFYSFKGGVGRTTTLARVAWALAKRGKRVVCVDLDLEAPGLADFTGANQTPSLLDALLTHAATGKLPVGDLEQDVTVHAQTFGVVPAGVLNRGYLEKLARLDYIGASSEADSPVAKALQAVLGRLRTRRPDVILLDCRAGLHDLGGLSLTDLAHVDVLVARDTPQNHEGLKLTLEVLARRRQPADLLLCVVQSLVPVEPDAALATTRRMTKKVKEACDRTIYKDLTDVPAEDAPDVSHAPLPLLERNDIAAAQRLADIRVDSIATGGVAEIVSRLLALIGLEGE